MGSQSGVDAACSVMPASLWIIVFMATTCALAALLVAWRSTLNGRRQVTEQLERAWQQTVRQLKHDAEQRAKARAHETEQLSVKLEHEAEQNARRQAAALRHGVYLEAAGALLNLHTLVVRMAGADCDEEAAWDAFAAKLERIVQVHLIATEATVEAVMVYLNEIAPGFLELTTLRRQLRDESVTRRYGGRAGLADLERERALSELLNLGEHASWPTPRDDADAASRSGDAREFDETTREALSVRFERRVEFSRRALRLANQSGKLLATALFALRNEMGESLDQRRYEQLWQVLVGKMEFVLKQDMESSSGVARVLRSAESGESPAAYGS
jgi:hypothetical protein